MKVGFCQFNVFHKDIEANLNKIKAMINKIEADLIVLPELCLTGYYFKSKDELLSYSNETNQQRIISELQILAKSNDLFIVAGISEKEEENLYNSAIVIGPEGYIGKHRKVNLTKNEMIFNRGNIFETIIIGNVKIGIAICFDSWFPESFRLLALKGAQIICCPSNFGGPWTLDVMKVRSLENKVYTIMANRIGSEKMENDEADFRGESQIIDYGGNVLAKAENDECIKIVDINPEDTITKNNIICDDMIYEMNLYKKYINYTV